MSSAPTEQAGELSAPAERLHALDATRAFALLLGIVFHASLSFMPFFIGWAVMDVSTGSAAAAFVLVSHSFRMELFFLLAGFFSARALRKQTAGRFALSRLVRLGIPFVAGWFLLRPLIVSGWVMGAASMRGDYDVAAALATGFKDLARGPGNLFTGTHLWFLYYLSLVTLFVLVVRAAGSCAPSATDRFMTRAGHAFRRLAGSWTGLLLFVAATAVVLWFMPGWGMDTPDRTLRPNGPVFLVYLGFYAFGWLCAREAGMIERFGRPAVWRWILAAAAIAGTILIAPAQMNTSAPNYPAMRAAFAFSYATMMWSLVSLSLGLFGKIASQPRRWVRYLADASYWLYLVHLPVVVWLQVVAAEWPVWWMFKLAAISLVAIGGGLLTYDAFVRSTAVGQLLNGRRQSRCIFKRPGLSPKPSA